MLGNHSSGGKKTNRKFTIYPKNLFKAKQATEKAKLERERLKIIEKFKEKDIMIGRPPDVPRTFREQVIKELYEEKYGPVTNADPNCKTIITSTMMLD